MASQRPFRSVIRLTIAASLLAIGLRTWLIMGLIEPVIVAGSSMAPTLRGQHALVHCQDCAAAIPLGLEFAGDEQPLRCPQCDSSISVGEPMILRPADRLWIDRTRFTWRDPERWEVVVARNPSDAEELCVKRVVGLPGELVSLAGGNVIIDGSMVTKNLQQQRRLRQLLHRETATNRRWQAQPNGSWEFDNGHWIHAKADSVEMSWLAYEHPGGSITDDITYNLGLTRGLNPVIEFQLSTRLHVRGKGTFTLQVNDGVTNAELQLHLPAGELLFEGDHPTEPLPIPKTLIAQLAAGTVQLELSNSDGQLLLALDGEILLKRPWPTAEAAGTSSPFAIGTQGLTVEIEDLALYRDLYYTPHAVGVPLPKARSWQLGQDEYFLLGDNSPVSLDSRLWGPVPRRLLVGKPISGR